MNNKIFMSSCVLLMLLSSGFIIYSWDIADDGVSLMSEDDYKDIEEAEERLEELSRNQLPIEEQLEELMRVETALYGRPISNIYNGDND